MVHISKVGPSGKSFQNSAVRLDKHQPSFFQLKFKGEKCQFGLFWVTCLYSDQRRVGQLDGLSLRKVSDVTLVSKEERMVVVQTKIKKAHR